MGTTSAGTAKARNILCLRATGDFIAFLDHDVLWHPQYLNTHEELYRRFPNVVSTFVGHENFVGFGKFDWPKIPMWLDTIPEIIKPADFILRYHSGVGPFMSMSFCCIQTKVLAQLGGSPFHVEFSGVDVIGCPYWVRLDIRLDGRPHIGLYLKPSLQTVKASAFAVRAMVALAPLYIIDVNPSFRRAFCWAFAVQHRGYGRILMRAGCSS